MRRRSFPIIYVVDGKLGQKTPDGVSYGEAGHTMNGHVAGLPMQVFNGGTADMTAPSCSWRMPASHFFAGRVAVNGAKTGFGLSLRQGRSGIAVAAMHAGRF